MVATNDNRSSLEKFKFIRMGGRRLVGESMSGSRQGGPAHARPRDCNCSFLHSVSETKLGLVVAGLRLDLDPE